MRQERKFVRFTTPLRVKIIPNKLNSEILAVAKDISLGGLKIILDKSLDISCGDIFDVCLLFPDRSVFVSGKVVWVKDYIDRKEIGFCFSNLRDSYKEDIYNYIFKYYPKEITKKWWQM